MWLKTCRDRSSLHWLRWALAAIGLVFLGYAGFAYLDRGAYQAYQDWTFQQEITSRAAPPAAVVPKNGALIGRLEIPRLHLRAIVDEGVDDRTLRRAVGHMPWTARPGERGNVALAGHRDSFFRSLQDIRKKDRIVIETLRARYEYVVYSLDVVEPSDVEAVAPTRRPELTLVTCYPFHYIGNAPQRFIVRARQTGKSMRETEGKRGRIIRPVPPGSSTSLLG